MDDATMSSPLFAGLQPAEIDGLLRTGRSETVPDGGVLFREGEQGDDFAVIESGQAVVEKTAGDGRVRRIAALGPGAVIGEVAAIEGGQRSATVRAAGPLAVRRFSIDALAAGADGTPAVSRLWRNLARSATSHLDRATDDILREARQREVAGQFAISTVGTICVYILTMRLVVSRFGTSEAAVSAITCGLIIVLAAITMVSVRLCGVTLAEVGCTLRGWRRSCIDALWMTALLMAVVVGFAIWTGTMRLPEFTLANAIRAGTYVLIVPLQEFATRGCIQGMLVVFLTGRFRGVQAVVLCNLVFCAMHTHLGDIFPLLVFLPGLAWGWLYARTPTLVGPSLSHALVGVAACFLFGIDG